MRIAVEISSPQKTYLFHFFACKSWKSEHQNIEPEFYIKWYGSVHEGVHFEMQILSKEIIHHLFMSKSPNPLHVHRSEKNNDYYVCWTGPLNNYPQAIEMLKFWCIGTVYTMETGVDFAKRLQANSINLLDFFASQQFFKEKYEIEFVSIEDGD